MRNLTMEKLKATEELLSYLGSLDIKLWVEGDRLKFNAPKEVLTPEIRTQIKEQKAEIIAFLQSDRFGRTPSRNYQTIERIHNPQLSSPLVPIQRMGSLPPFFCVHPVGGNVLCYAELARQLSVEQPFYGLQAVGLYGEEEPLTRIENMATTYIKAIQIVQPEGPYQLGGWSFGGIVAFEIAQQLHSLGHKVALLVLIDSFNQTILNKSIPDEAMLVTSFAKNLSRCLDKELPLSTDELQQLRLDEQLNYILEKAKKLQVLPSQIGTEQMQQLFAIFQTNVQAIHSYVPQPYSGEITFFCAEEKSEQLAEKQIESLSSLAVGGINIHKLTGDHFSIIRSEVLAKELGLYLRF